MSNDMWPVAKVEIVPYEDHDDPTVTSIFLQWKGTHACFDLYCECGEEGHFDGYFAHAVACAACGRVYVMPATIFPAPFDGSTGAHSPVVAR